MGARAIDVFTGCFFFFFQGNLGWLTEEVERQHQRMDRPGVRQVPEGSGEKRKMEENGCEIICGALTTLVVKGQVR